MYSEVIMYLIDKIGVRGLIVVNLIVLIICFFIIAYLFFAYSWTLKEYLYFVRKTKRFILEPYIRKIMKQRRDMLNMSDGIIKNMIEKGYSNKKILTVFTEKDFPKNIIKRKIKRIRKTLKVQKHAKILNKLNKKNKLIEKQIKSL